MVFNDFAKWLTQDFGYPVPDEYLSFLEKGDFISSFRKYYMIDSENIIEISKWYTHENISEIYRNCREEKMIDEYHLPIFDSCGCTVILNCNPQNDLYGQVFLRTPTGYWDENLKHNVYLELDFIATNFSKIINNFKSEEELEKMGIF